MFSSKIQHRGLTGEETALGRTNYGCETAVAPRFNAFVVEVRFVSAAAPGRGGGAIFGTVSPLLCASRAAAFSTRRRRSGDADIREGIHESGINIQAFAVNHPSLGWNCGIFAYGRDNAARNNDGRAFRGRAGNGKDLCAAYGKVLRLATLRIGYWRMENEKQESGQAQRGRTPAQQFEAHANPPAKIGRAHV